MTSNLTGFVRVPGTQVLNERPAQRTRYLAPLAIWGASLGTGAAVFQAAIPFSRSRSIARRQEIHRIRWPRLMLFVSVET